MSSSLSDLRNFRMNKTSSNGTIPSNKLANGRKRIRAVSDSSDDEHVKQQTASQTSPSKPIQNGSASTLSVKDKEERYKIFREIVDNTVDSLTLQDFLVQNDWDIQMAFDALQANPKYKNTGNHSSPIVQSALVSPKTETSTSTEGHSEPRHKQKQNKVRTI